ncbi:MAG TPA: Crp/Fnr family transcriptional regulator [Opitutaceae bacterium]|nr:Crp/Fnr family transcriptional regulator [Opitutaceae bacterium]HRJ47444.1 Crp/Fnr family transcriptional regulator [Opitutaceae bacterium]
MKLAVIGNVLRCSQLFAALPTEDLAAIARLVVLLKLAKNAYLFREGEPSKGFYLVQSGAVNVHRMNAAGKEQVIHVFRAGETLAEASLASPTGYPANARAVEPSGVLLLPKVPILGMIARNPDLALRMLGSMGAHLRVVVGMLDDLALKDVETRLLNWLVKQSRSAPGGTIRLEGTKRVLAAELGTGSETFSRTLARLRDEGLIRVSGRTIIICDAGGLRSRLQRNLGGGGGSVDKPKSARKR